MKTLVIDTVNGAGESQNIWGEPGVLWRVASRDISNRKAGPTRVLEWSEESKRKIEELNFAQRTENGQWHLEQCPTMGTDSISERPRKRSIPDADINTTPLAQNTSSEYLTLPQAAARLAVGGKKPSTCTLWRWARRGYHGVYLEYRRFGKDIRVTEAALAKFARALAANDKPLGSPRSTRQTSTPKPHNTSRRAKEISEAENFLRRRGLM